MILLLFTSTVWVLLLPEQLHILSFNNLTVLHIGLSLELTVPAQLTGLLVELTQVDLLHFLLHFLLLNEVKVVVNVFIVLVVIGELVQLHEILVLLVKLLGGGVLVGLANTLSLFYGLTATVGGL